jgi:hypothetical membrane protein
VTWPGPYDQAVQRIPWWAVASAAGAPVFLIGGWTIAAARQPAAYNPLHDTISALAGLGATDRWIMTAGLAGLGISYAVTALGLLPAAPAGRLTLALGGVATLLVSALPLPRVGTSSAHGIAALVAFVALAIWPVLARRSRVNIVASIVLLLIVGWFGLSLSSGHLVGLSERCAAGAEALWPLIAVLTLRAGTTK